MAGARNHTYGGLSDPRERVPECSEARFFVNGSSVLKLHLTNPGISERHTRKAVSGGSSARALIFWPRVHYARRVLRESFGVLLTTILLVFFVHNRAWPNA